MWRNHKPPAGFIYSMENENFGLTHIGEIMGGFIKRPLPSKPVHFEHSDNYFYKLNCIKNYYEFYHSEIIEHNKENPYSFYSSYHYDWDSIFTPIERWAWHSIRCKGRLVLYPQYPVGKYYLDFANPLLKIGVELDGAAFHDTEKDKKRDIELHRMGWTIYRIKGSEMFVDSVDGWDAWPGNYYEESEYIDRVENWIMKTGDGVLESIKVMHFNGEIFAPNELFQEKFRNMCEVSLIRHKLIHHG